MYKCTNISLKIIMINIISHKNCIFAKNKQEFGTDFKIFPRFNTFTD